MRQITVIWQQDRTGQAVVCGINHLLRGTVHSEPERRQLTKVAHKYIGQNHSWGCLRYVSKEPAILLLQGS